MNITDPIWGHAEAFPERPAVYCDGRVLSFGTFCRHVDRAAWSLAAAGISSGQRVAVASANPLMHLVAILALARLGATSAAVSLGSPPETQSELARKCGITAFVRSHAAWRIAGVQEKAHILTDGLVSDGKLPPGGLPVLAGASDQPWRIALSSGTTGVQKGVTWTHGQSSRYLQLLQTVFPSGPSERVLMHMDTSLVFALHGLLRQLCAGGALVVPRAIDSAEFFTCVERDRVTQAMTSTAQAWNLLQYANQREPSETEASRSLRYLVIGGSAISAPMQAALRRRICSNLYVNYGSSEGGLLARADPDSLERFPGAAGYLVPWVEAQTVDDDGAVLPKGTHGNLRFRIPAAASGYEGDSETSARVFHDGWYYPGDTGSVDSRGLLRIGARADDIINIGGTKIDPLVVEAVLNEDPAVRESVVFGAVTDKGAPVLIGVVAVRSPIDANALRAKCRDRLGPQLSPASIVTIERLPRNSEGKILRREVMRMVRVTATENKPGDEKSAG